MSGWSSSFFLSRAQACIPEADHEGRAIYIWHELFQSLNIGIAIATTDPISDSLAHGSLHNNRLHSASIISPAGQVLTPFTGQHAFHTSLMKAYSSTSLLCSTQLHLLFKPPSSLCSPTCSDPYHLFPSSGSQMSTDHSSKPILLSSPRPSYQEIRYRIPVLHPSDAEEPERRGLLTHPLDGKRKISPSAYGFKHENYTIAPIRIHPLAYDAPEAREFAEIPVYMESVATFEFLGFSEKAANQLWKHWTEIPGGRPEGHGDDTVLNLAMDHLESFTFEDAEDPEDDWNFVLMEFGIGKKLRDVILAEQFAPVKFICKMTAIDIVAETFLLRWDELWALYESSWSRAEGLMNMRQKAVEQAAKMREISNSYRMEWLAEKSGKEDVGAGEAVAGPSKPARKGKKRSTRGRARKRGEKA